MRKFFPSGDVARYAGIFVGLASACLGLVINRTAIGQLLEIDLSILDDRRFIFAIMGVLTVAAAIIILWIVGQIFHHTIVAPARVVVTKLEKIISHFGSFELAQCTNADIDEVSELATECFGSFAASADRNRALLSIDNRSYWKLSNGKRIVGFIAFLDLLRPGLGP